MSKIIYNLLVSIVVATVLYGLYSHNVNAQTANIQYNVYIKPELHSRSWVVFTLFTEVINSNLTYSDFLKLKKIIECESNYDVHAVGDNGKARSIFQMWEKTFNTFQKESNIKGEYLDPISQIRIAIWAYKNHKMSHWTCFTKFYPEDEHAGF